MGGEGKNNRCRNSRCQTFSLSLRSGENNWTGGAQKRNNYAGTALQCYQLQRPRATSRKAGLGYTFIVSDQIRTPRGVHGPMRVFEIMLQFVWLCNGGQTLLLLSHMPDLWVAGSPIKKYQSYLFISHVRSALLRGAINAIPRCNIGGSSLSPPYQSYDV